MSSSFRFGMGLEGEICWGPFPWWVGLPQLERKLNAIICGGLVFHNWRHFFLFAINHGKCSCLFLQRMPINWHSMKRRDPSQKSPTILLF